METSRSTIILLILDGCAAANAADAETNIHRAAVHGREAHAYLNAANALLAGFPQLHNDLIERPHFVTLRRFARRFPV